MSTYYNINGLKVRVSDHEPNTALRGGNDIYFWTKSPICDETLSVVSQVESYCEKHDLDINLFSDILRDFPDPVKYPNPIKRIEISSDFHNLFMSITGKGMCKKQKRLCEQHNVSYYQISQGYYIVK